MRCFLDLIFHAYVNVKLSVFLSSEFLFLFLFLFFLNAWPAVSKAIWTQFLSIIGMLQQQVRIYFQLLLHPIVPPAFSLSAFLP